MSDDWKVGDLAVCIINGPFGIHSYCPTLTEGRVYRVGSIQTRLGIECLTLADAATVSPDTGFFNALRFRKIRPDEHEDCEPEFVTLLNRIKRKVSA